MKRTRESRNRRWSLHRIQALGRDRSLRLRVPATLLTIIVLLVGCSSCTWNIDLVNYEPIERSDWAISTPEEQGLARELLDNAYFNAAKLETLYGMLVVKNGYLIGEAYFNEGSVDQVSGRQSATKSVTSGLVGIALAREDLESLDRSSTTATSPHTS